MIDEKDLPPPPAPPVITSFYAGEEDTERFEQAIAEIMQRESVSKESATQIYQVQGNMILGSDRFKADVEKQTGGRMKPKKVGRTVGWRKSKEE